MCVPDLWGYDVQSQLFTGDIYAIIIPVVIIVVVLKVTLICCRIWFYQKVCVP